MERRTALLLFAGAAAACGGSEPKQLTPAEIAKLVEKPGDTLFLDVREPHEIAELGIVKGYLNIPLGQLEQRIKEIPRGRTIVPV